MRKLYLFIITIGMIIFGLLNTTQGLHAIIFTLKNVLPGDLAIRQASGKVLGNIALSDVHYHNKDVNIDLSSLKFSWNPRSLISGKIKVNQLKIDKLAILLNDQDNGSTSNKQFDYQFYINLLKHLRISNFHMDDFTIESVTLQKISIASIDLSEIEPLHYKLNIISSNGDIAGRVVLQEGDDISWTGELSAKNINLNYAGNSIKNLQLNIAIKSRLVSNQIKYGYLLIDNVSGEVNKLPLQGSASIEYSDNLIIKSFNMALGKSYLKLSGTVAKQWDVQYQLSLPNTNEIIPNVTGKVEAVGEISGEQRAPIISSHLFLTQLKSEILAVEEFALDLSGHLGDKANLALRITGNNIVISGYKIKNCRGEVTAQKYKNALQGHANLMVADSSLKANYQLANFEQVSGLDQPILVNAIISMPDIAKLVESPYVDKIKGSLLGSVKISGNLLKPIYQLKAQIKNAQFRIVSTGTYINNLNIELINKYSDLMLWSGNFNAGQGSATFNAKTSLNSASFLKSDISFSGDNLQLMNSADFRLIVSPTLKITYDGSLLETKGNVYIPSVKIVKLKSSKVVNLSDDVVYAGEKNESTNLQYACHIKLTLGDDIKLNYENIKAKVQGSIELTKSKYGQLNAVGTLSAKDGTYQAYGKELTIKTGKIIYVGNTIFNPGLDVEAVHTINRVGDSGTEFINNNKITVGVKVNGSLSQPKLSLISTPTMSQNDILSYLLFDTPASRLSLSNSITLMNMVASMNGGDSKTSMLGDMQKKIDSLGISMDSAEVFDPVNNTNTTASTIGINKKIGKKITISYQTSPFNNFAVFVLRYQLSKYLALRTEASNIETTTDLVFEIENE